MGLEYGFSQNRTWHFLNLIWKYFQMYWLKPFDAVNDAANAEALLNFDWSKGPILEIGGGDGVFSFIMHGGEFAFTDDRYDQTDPGKAGDIYDTYEKGKNLTVKKRPHLQYDAGVDLKMSHIYKARETGLYREGGLISSVPESLPLEDNSYSTIFLYTFHGLTDYKKTLLEIRRVIRKDGTLLMIGVNKSVKDHFICYNLYRYFEEKGWKRLSGYFKGLDGGRHDEIGGIFAKDLGEWKYLFAESGFLVEEIYSQVSPLIWRIYDTQTRPILKKLIQGNLFLKKFHLKPLFKFVWVIIWFPILVASYLLGARPIRISPGGNHDKIFFTIRAIPL